MPRPAGPARVSGRPAAVTLVAVLSLLAGLVLSSTAASAQVVLDPPPDTSTATTTPTPPGVPTVTLAVDGPLSLHWTWDQGTGVTAACTLVGPTTSDRTAKTCDGGSLALVVGPAPGDYALEVVLTQDGLTGAPGTSEAYTVLPVPDQPAVDSALVTGGDARDVDWSWSTPSGARADCTLTAPGGSVQRFDGCTSPRRTRLTNLPGTHTFAVVLTTNGGASPAGRATRDLAVAPPSPATITGPTSGAARAVSWSWPAAEDGGARCTLTGPVPVDAPVCSAGGWSTVLPEANGDYVLTVVRTGPGGESAPVSATYTLTLPTPTGPAVSAATVDPTTRLATWTWAQATDEAGRCTLTGPHGVVDAVDCTGTVTLPLPEENGDYVLGVVLSSVRGTSTPGYSPAYTLVLPKPAQPQVSGPTGTTGTRAATYDWPLGAGESSACTLVGPTGSDRTPLPCAPPFDTVLPPSSGTYRLEVVVTGPGGDSPVGTSPDLVLDVTPPDPPAVTARQGATGSSPTPSWTVTVDPGATGRCTLTAGTGPAAPVDAGPVDCGSPTGAVFTSPALADGLHVLSVVARDSYGNTSSAASSSYLLDTVAPAAPVLAADRPVAGRSTAPSFAFTLPGDADSAECRTTAPDGTAGDWAACTSPTTLQLGLKADGPWLLEVRSVDAAGNRTAVPAATTYLLDTTPPALTVSGPEGTGNDPAPVWSWSSTETPATVDCTLVRLDPLGPTDVETAPCGSGSYRPTLPADADYAVRVTAADRYGNARTATTAAYRFDATAPALPVVAGPTGPSTTTTVTWTWTGEGTPSCTLLRDGVPQAVGCTDRSLTLTLPGSGTYVLSVRMTDAARNTGDPGSSPPYVVDVTAPDAPVVTVPALGRSRAPQYQVQSETGSTLSCRLVVPLGASPWGPCTSPYTADLSTAADGLYVLEVTATDRLGNTSATGSGSYRLDTTPPAAPVVLGPVGTGNDPAPRWTWTGEAGTTASCLLLPGTTAVPCTSPFTPALPGDGSYAVQVVLTDPAGNPSAPGTSGTYLYDGTPPAPARITGPGATGNTAAVSWTFTGEGTARCRLLHDGVPGAWSVCAGGYSALLDGDGAWALQVELTDVAGNTSVTTGPVYLLDRQAPGAPVVNGPSGPSSQAVVSWSVSTETDSRVECRLTGPDAGPFAACGSTVLRSLSTDGVHVLEARLVDAAGNTGPVGRSPEYLLDRVAPVAPAVDGPTGPSSSASPTWTFRAEDGATSECQVLREGVPVTGWSGCGSPVARDLSAQPDGALSLAVRSTDAARNTGPVGTSPRYVLDRTAPAAPAVTGPAGPTRTASDLVSFTGEPGTSAACRAVRAGAPAPDFVPCSSPFTPSLDADGAWTAEVRLTDAAGNTGPVGRSAAWVLDTRAPDAPVVSGPRSPGRDQAPTWTLAAEDGARLECRLTTPAGSVPDWSPCSSPWATPVTGDGTYTLEARATDAAGSTGPAGRATYVLDTAAPAAPILAAPPTPSRERAPAFTFVLADGDTAACRITRGSTLLQDWKPCQTTSPVLQLATAVDGAYTLAVRVTDPAGNTGPAATSTYVLDTTAPLPPSATDVPASPNPSRRPVFGFTAEAGTTLSCRVRDAARLLVLDVACADPWTADLVGLPDGTYTYAVRATDAAGNVSEPLSGSYVLDSTAPEVASVRAPLSPSSSRSPVWTLGPTAGTAECRLVRGTTVVADYRPCSGTYVADLATAVDATYVLNVRVRDDAGNVSPVTTSPYVLDTTPAAAARITPPRSPGNQRTPTWSLASSEVGGTAVCRVLSGTGPLSTTVFRPEAPCEVSAAGAPLTLDLAGQPDGVYVLAVRVTDAAGNPGTEQTSPYVLDTVQPDAVRVLEPASPNRDPRPSWYLSSEAGAVFSCQVSSGSTIVFPRGRCSSPFSVQLDPPGDGTYTFSVQAEDAAGNPGPDRPYSYVLDRTAPVRVSQLQGPAGPASDRTPTWTFLVQDGAHATCRLTRGRVTVRDEACRSPYSPSLAGQPDGTYTLTVLAVDDARNAALPEQRSYVLDTTAPAQPDPVLTPGSPSSSTAPRFAWTVAPDATSLCRTTRDGAVLLDWAACPEGWTASLADAPDGTYGLQVRAVDVAGNTSAATTWDYRLDRTAGTLTTFSQVPAAVDNDPDPRWQLETEPGQTAQCRLSGPGLVGAWSSCDPSARGAAAVPAGTYTAHLGTRPDGRYVLEVRSVPATGQPGPVSSSAYGLDRQPPSSVRFTDALDGTTGKADRITWVWESPDADAVVECRVLRDQLPFEPADGSWTRCGASRALALDEAGPAAYSLQVRTRDRAGNTGAPQQSTYRYDPLPPGPVVFAGAPVLAPGGRSLTWTFSQDADAHATCTVTRDGQALGPAQPCERRYELSAPRPGTYSLYVTVTDDAGNTRQPAVSRPYAVVAPPDPVRVVTTDDPAVDLPGPQAGPPTGLDAVPDPQPLPPLGSTPPAPQGLLPGAPLSPVDVLARVVRLGQEDVDVPSTVDRVVDSVRDALPDTITLPRLDEYPAVIGRVVGGTLRGAARRPGLPLALVLVVVGFLLVQNRIDRRDPKLASAPVDAEPELVFGPVLRRPGGPAAGGLPA